MKRFELILAVTVLLALVMKLLHLPMASFLLVLSISTLSMSYWFGALWFGVPSRRDGTTWLSVLTGVACSLALLGCLYKLQYWPFSGMFLLMGAMMCIVMSVLVLTQWTSVPDLRAYHSSLLRRLAIIAIPAVMLYFTRSKDMARFQYRDDPVYAELFVQHLEHPADTAIWNAMDRHRMNRMMEQAKGN